MLVDPKFVEDFVDYFTSPRNTSVSSERYNELVGQFNDLLAHAKEFEKYATDIEGANQKLTTELNKALDSKKQLDVKIAELTSASMQDVSGIRAKVQKIVNYRDHLVKSISPNQAISGLTVSDKQTINIKLLAFTELLYISEGTINYARKLNHMNWQNTAEELEILANAITSDNNLQIPAITAYGYLSMANAALDNLSNVYYSYTKTQINPGGAQNWLTEREAELRKQKLFVSNSSEIDITKIPPLFKHPSEFDEEMIKHKHQVSVSLSGATRKPFDEFVHEGRGRWPYDPNNEELKKGPNDPRHDIGLIFMDAEQTKRIVNRVAKDSITKQILTGDYDPIMMNSPIDAKNIQDDRHRTVSDFIENHFSKLALK